jgi:hypothetical protein
VPLAPLAKHPWIECISPLLRGGNHHDTPTSHSIGVLQCCTVRIHSCRNDSFRVQRPHRLAWPSRRDKHSSFSFVVPVDPVVAWFTGEEACFSHIVAPCITGSVCLVSPSPSRASVIVFLESTSCYRRQSPVFQRVPWVGSRSKATTAWTPRKKEKILAKEMQNSNLFHLHN